MQQGNNKNVHVAFKRKNTNGKRFVYLNKYMYVCNMRNKN